MKKKKRNERILGQAAVNLSFSFLEDSIKDGKGDNKFVITVAPQKLICPKGKT